MVERLGSEDECDVVIVGSGAAGMMAALTVRAAGLDVRLFEKTDRLGGSTAVSGGALWLPLNAQAAAVGHPDSREQVQAYLTRVVGDSSSDAMRDAFLDSVGPMLTFLEDDCGIRFQARSYGPDYYPSLEAAALGGRTMDPLPFDGRLLGRTVWRQLRDPLPEFLVLGGMMVTLSDVHHLLRPLSSWASLRAGMALVLRYVGDRLAGYHRGTRLVLGNALAAHLLHALVQKGVPWVLGHRACRLLRDDRGVWGAEFERNDGTRLRVRARKGVVLAGGGFPWNIPLRQEHYPDPAGAWSMAPATNKGEVIQLALDIGAAWGEGEAEPAFWAPVSVQKHANGREQLFPHLVWDRAKPGLIAVDSAGQRFVNEACSYHEFVLAMRRVHSRRSCIPAFLICDHDFIEKWGLGLALPGGRPRGRLLRSGYLLKADDLTSLAQLLGVPANALCETVDRVNQDAMQGVDTCFHKGESVYDQYLGDPNHRPNPCFGPVQRPPFYAVRVYPGDIGTAKGLRTNEDGQVLHADGVPIVGLYAAGNDMQSIMGGHYPAAGITLGPALVFGYRVGQAVAAVDNRQA